MALIEPVDSKTPEMEASAEKVDLPVTARVDERVVAPVTPRVPLMVALPPIEAVPSSKVLEN